jgi:hypothetical protein
VLSEQVVEPAGLDGDALDPDLVGALAGLLGHVLPGEDDLCPGVLEVVLDLATLEQWVHRYDDRTRREGSVEQDREGGDVGQHQTDPVTRTDSLGRQQRRDPARTVLEFPVGHHHVVEAHRRTIGVLLGCLAQVVGEIGHVGLQGRSSRSRFGATPRWGAPLPGRHCDPVRVAPCVH